MNSEISTAAIGADNKATNTMAAQVIRWTGLAAVAGGIIFAGIQPIHPPDYVTSVNTGAWAIITTLKTVMCLFFLLGIAGIYARQVNKAGWVGLAGASLLIISWWLQTAFVFAETFILPLLATAEPEFVDAVLGTLARSQPSTVDLGALPTIYSLGVGITYMLGGLLFGVATLRAAILPRPAAILLTVVSALTPAAALLPHEIQRLAGIPVGLALAWLGFAVWSQGREHAQEIAAGRASTQLRQSAAE